MEGLYVVLLQPAFVWLKGMYIKFFLCKLLIASFFVRGRISSVARALTSDLEVAGSIPRA